MVVIRSYSPNSRHWFHLEHQHTRSYIEPLANIRERCSDSCRLISREIRRPLVHSPSFFSHQGSRFVIQQHIQVNAKFQIRLQNTKPMIRETDKYTTCHLLDTFSTSTIFKPQATISSPSVQATLNHSLYIGTHHSLLQYNK